MPGEPPPGMPDINALLAKVGEMQQSLLQAQQAATSVIYEGRAGGGAVRIRATGDLQFKDIKIDPLVVASGDVEMLQDLVLAAIRDVVERAASGTTKALGGLGDLGALGFGGLLGGRNTDG